MHEYKPLPQHLGNHAKRGGMTLSSNPLLEVGNVQHTNPSERHTTANNGESRIFSVLGEMKKQELRNILYARASLVNMYAFAFMML